MCARTGLATFLTALLLLAVPVAAEDTPTSADDAVSYWRDVRPILVDNCQGCHQPAKAAGKVILSSFEGMASSGDEDEPVVVPGKPEESHLWLEIVPRDGEAPSMPKKLPPLSETQTETVRRWILQGAEDDTPESVRSRPTMDSPPVYSTPPVVTSIAYSPDGALIAVSGYHEVLLHRADGTGVVTRLVGLSERIESVAFSPDGKLLAVTGGSPCRMGEVQIWDLEKSKLRVSATFTHDTLYGVSWSPDGSKVAFGCADNTLRAIDAKSGEQVLFQGAHNDWVLDTVFSVDGSHLVSVSRDRSMKLIKVDTEQFIDNITSITPGALKGGLMTVDRHPTREELLCGGADGVPKIFRMHREKARKIGDDYNLIRAFEAVEGRIFDAAFNHDGSLIVVGSSHEKGGIVRVYQTEDGKVLWSVESPGGVFATAFSPDSTRVAVGGFDGKIRLIDVAEGKVAVEFDPVPLTPSESPVAARIER